MPKAEETETHVLYVDDSGTKEYSPSGVYGSGNTRYFVFGGPFLTVDQAKRLTTQIRKLKTEIFRTDNVEIVLVSREHDSRLIKEKSVGLNVGVPSPGPE